MHILIVTMHAKPFHRDEFLRELLVNAESSRANEPGCLRFDVVQDASDRNIFHLYEVYRNEVAFADHQASPHYLRLREMTADWREGPPIVHTGVNLSPHDTEWA